MLTWHPSQNSVGEESHLAIETSGHGATKENHWLDDGAYLMVGIGYRRYMYFCQVLIDSRSDYYYLYIHCIVFDSTLYAGQAIKQTCIG